MKKPVLFIVAVVVPCFISQLAGAAGGDTKNRYMLSETEEGTIRLDRQSGEVSFCRPANGGVKCTIAADERQAWIKSVEELNERMDEMERRIDRLETRSTSSGGSDNPAPLSKEEEQKLDKAMRVGEDFFRRFMGIVKDLEKSYGESE